MSDCQFCGVDAEVCCASQSPLFPFYKCIRPEGHDGPHVACDMTRHDIERWADNPEQEQEG